MKKSIILSIVLVVFLVMFLVSCNDSGKVRKSTEENVEIVKKEAVKKAISPHGNMMTKPTKQVDYKWDVPKGWEVGNSTSNIRLATYIIKEGKTEALCTMIPLLGDGGGLEANVKLWLEQVGIKMELNTKEFKDFINKSLKFKTSSGFDVIMIDTSIIKQKDVSDSLLVSMVKVDEYTVFIKFKGEESILLKNKDKFIGLTKSLKIKNKENGK